MNINEIKLGLELWDNRQPVEPPLNKHDEILYDTIKMRAKIFENNAVESVRYLLSIIEQAEKALKSAQADISSLTLAFEEETTSNTTIEEVIEDGRMSKSWIEIIEALQAIRKGD